MIKSMRPLLLAWPLLAFATAASSQEVIHFAPTASTDAATNLDTYSVTLNATVTPPQVTTAVTTAWFEYGPVVSGTVKTYLKTPAQIVPGTDATPVAFSLTGLKPNTAYSYHVAAQTDGSPAMFVMDVAFTTLATGVPVTLNAQTVTNLMQAVGDTGVSLSLSASKGSSPVFQWYHGTALVTATTGAAVEDYPAKSSTLSFAPITAAMAGLYTCRASNPVTTPPAVSTPATLLSVVGITASSHVVKPGTTFTLTATVTPADPHATYSWTSTNDAALGAAKTGTVTGSTGPVLTVKNAVAGTTTNTFMCTVTSSLGSRLSATADTVVLVPPAPSFGTLGSQSCNVSQPVNLSIPVTDAASVTATGLPAGLALAHTRGITPAFSIVGTPTKATSVNGATVSLAATNVSGTTRASFTLTITALPATVANTFNGLVDRTYVPFLFGASPLARQNLALGGAGTLTVASTGSYTGSISIGNLAIPFKGQLDTTAVPTGVSRSFNTTLGIVTITVSIDTASGKLTGTVDMAAAQGIAFTAWSKSPGFAATVSGLHNLYTNDAATPDTSAPQGASFGSATISAAGAVSLSMNMADTKTFTNTSLTIGSTGQIPVHKVLYATGAYTGSVHGWISVTPGTPYHGIGSDSVLSWNKSVVGAGANDRLYPAGFDYGASNDNSLGVTGSEQRVVPNDILWAANTAPLSLGLSLANGGLADAAQAAEFASALATSTDKNYKSTLTATHPSVTLSITGSTGAFTGGFTLTDTVAGKAASRAVTYHGVFAPGLKAGRGYFILTSLTGGNLLTNTQLSGSVDLK